MIRLTVNGQQHEVEVPAGMPLLWVLRDTLGLTGTKYGCGRALCGACTVHVDGDPVRACVTPASSVQGQAVTTIEGLGSPTARAVQAAWREHDVVQCGYCQSGQIMAATALLERNPSPSSAEIDSALGGNLCRCATYRRIREAVRAVAQSLA